MGTAVVWTAILAAAVGVELNVRRDRRGFFLWLYSNGVQVSFAIWIFAHTGHWGAIGNALMFTYYWMQALRGLRAWGKGD